MLVFFIIREVIEGLDSAIVLVNRCLRCNIWSDLHDWHLDISRHRETFFLFHQPAERVSLCGNHCVSMMGQLLWLLLTLEEFMRDRWHCLHCTLLTLAVTRATGALYRSKHTCVFARGQKYSFVV